MTDPRVAEIARKEAATEWARQIINAGGNENVAQQAVTLGALNGLFDIYASLRSPLPEERKIGELIEWPDSVVTNPDIAEPTGIPYIDSLLHRLLDAQQDLNFQANERMSQSLCDASALFDEIETAIRKLAALDPLQGEEAK